MTDFDYDSWRASIEQAIRGLLVGFEQRFGFPPDEHIVGPPSDPAVLAKARAAGTIPDVLLEFYHHVGEVSLPDVHVGYFVHPLRQVLDNEKSGMPVRASALTSSTIVVFGSDGGGSLFALDGRGAPVYLLPSGGVRDGTYTGGLEPPEVLAPTFGAFLDWLKERVEAFSRS